MSASGGLFPYRLRPAPPHYVGLREMTRNAAVFLPMDRIVGRIHARDIIRTSSTALEWRRQVESMDA